MRYWHFKIQFDYTANDGLAHPVTMENTAYCVLAQQDEVMPIQLPQTVLDIIGMYSFDYEKYGLCFRKRYIYNKLIKTICKDKFDRLIDKQIAYDIVDIGNTYVLHKNIVYKHISEWKI